MKVKISIEDLRNWWLQKYHNTTCDDVLKDHPTEAASPVWFTLYPVTQEQHDEWYEWAITAISKNLRISKKFVRKHFTIDYLDCAPTVIENPKTQ